jgi:hypothetical protein
LKVTSKLSWLYIAQTSGQVSDQGIQIASKSAYVSVSNESII